MSWNLINHQRRLLASEQGTVIFAPGARQPFALLYPNHYRTGMSNLGLQIIYRQINNRPDTAAERFFLPDPEQLREHLRTNTPLLSLETQRPLSEFPLLGFAVSFEMDYFHILDMLNLGRIPLQAHERDEQDPIVIIGGPCATFNPEPLAEFVDVCIIGEGEDVINELLDRYYYERSQGASRREVLLALAQIPGIYVPAFYRHDYEQSVLINSTTLADVPEKISRRWLEDLDAYNGGSAIITPNTEFSDMYLLEISRGCGRHCRFCMAGYCFRKPRYRSLTTLQATVFKLAPPAARIGLMGAAVSDYPEIDQLCQVLADDNRSMSVASLRADSVSAATIKSLVSSGHRTLTLAPEAGSERLRRVINKNITDADLEVAVERALDMGISHIRLYIMVGLPTETADDLMAIAVMARKIRMQMDLMGNKGKLILSINPFVPKPFTPFQWMPMTELTLVNQRLKWLQAELKQERRIELLIEAPRDAYIQSILARGDRRIAKVLLIANKLGGAKAWRQALKQSGLTETDYLYRDRCYKELLPWHRLDPGFTATYLWQEFQAAQTETYTPPCNDNCRRCGVCS